MESVRVTTLAGTAPSASDGGWEDGALKFWNSRVEKSVYRVCITFDQDFPTTSSMITGGNGGTNVGVCTNDFEVKIYCPPITYDPTVITNSGNPFDVVIPKDGTV